MLDPITTTQFEKDKKKALKQRRDFTKINLVLKRLIEEEPLDSKYCDHPLKGEWKGFRDCHIENDFVLIYKIDKSSNKIIFVRLGSHSELFG